MKAAIENGHTFLQPVKASSSSGTRNDSKALDEHRKWAEKRRIEGLAQERVVSLIVPKAEAMTAEQVVRLVGQAGINVGTHAMNRRGWKTIKEASKFVAAATREQLQGVMVEQVWDIGRPPELLKAFGIDLKKITKQVAAEEKAKAKAAAKASTAW